MNKKIIKFKIFSIIFCIIFGTLLHFTFEWSGNNNIVGAFSAVNESTWEHLKLAFFPMLITTIIGYFYIGKENDKYICARALAIIAAILFITIFFYTYTGIIGTNYAFLDIGSFFVAIFLGEYVSYKRLKSEKKCNKILSITFIFVILLSFIIFTFNPPEIQYFKDPITNSYGILKK